MIRIIIRRLLLLLLLIIMVIQIILLLRIRIIIILGLAGPRRGCARAVQGPRRGVSGCRVLLLLLLLLLLLIWYCSILGVVCFRLYVCVNIYRLLSVLVLACLCLFTLGCLGLQTGLRRAGPAGLPACMYVYMYVCMYVYTYIYIYIYI